MLYISYCFPTFFSIYLIAMSLKAHAIEKAYQVAVEKIQDNPFSST